MQQIEDLAIRADGRYIRLSDENTRRVLDYVGGWGKLSDLCPIVTLWADGEGGYVKQSGGFGALDVTKVWVSLNR